MLEERMFRQMERQIKPSFKHPSQVTWRFEQAVPDVGGTLNLNFVFSWKWRRSQLPHRWKATYPDCCFHVAPVLSVPAPGVTPLPG